jgi:tetratricopeptide (TPR) repeat protein
MPSARSFTPFSRTAPPIDAKNARQALIKVAKGDIAPPERRAPGRSIAKELSAVAMMALARDPRDRYASVQELSRDIERFLDGRAVSAKSDNALELLKKLLLRNRGVSMTAGIAIVLLAAVVSASFLSIRDALEKAVAGESAAKHALAEAESARRDKVRSLAEQAVRAAETGFFADAETLANTAIEVAPGLVYGSWAMGVRAFDRGDLDSAREWLQKAVARDAEFATAAHARVLAALGELEAARNVLAAMPEVVESRDAVATGEVLLRLKDYSGAATAFRRALELHDSDPTVPLSVHERVQRQLRDAEVWGESAGFFASVQSLEPVKQAQALREKMNEIHGVTVPFSVKILPDGMRAQLEGERLKYLHPLTGFPIRELHMLSTSAVDLSPLRGLPLRSALIHHMPLKDLGPLAGMPLVNLDLQRTQVTDLSPLRGIAIETLSLKGNAELADIAALAGMPLRKLSIYGTKVTDLAALRGMPLEELEARFLKVGDLTPLVGAPLKFLDLRDTLVSDLSPLAGMPLTRLLLRVSPVSDLSPLRAAALTQLTIPSTKVSDLSPLRDAPIEILDLRRSAVRDLSPIAGMPLRELYLSGRKYLTPESLVLVDALPSSCNVIYGD